MTRARRLHKAILAPLWAAGLYTGIAIGVGVFDVVRHEWTAARNARRAEREGQR